MAHASGRCHFPVVHLERCTGSALRLLPHVERVEWTQRAILTCVSRIHRIGFLCSSEDDGLRHRQTTRVNGVSHFARRLDHVMSSQPMLSNSTFDGDAGILSKSLGALPHLFITGAAGHGKDTVGDHLIACYGYEKLSFSDGIRKEIALAYTPSPLPVTPGWQDNRDIKELPQPRLALKHCKDDAFVKVALACFTDEDNRLFDQLKAHGRASKKSAEKPNGGMTILDFALKCEEPTDAFRLLLPRSPRRIQQIWGTEYRRTQDPLYWLKYAETKTNFSQPQVLTSVRYANELEFGERIGAVRVHVNRPGAVAAADHITERVLPFDANTILISNDGSLRDLLRKVDAVVAKIVSRAGVDNTATASSRQRACP